MEIQIEPLEAEDIEPASRLTANVIKDSFKKENIEMPRFQKELQVEIDHAQRKINDSLTGNYHLFTAKINGEIVGTAGYSLKLSPQIQTALEKLGLPEEKTLEVMLFYVDPTHQGTGIGSKLFQTVLGDLSNTNCQYYSLHTGYKEGKGFWTHELGEPTITLKNYYPGPADCYVWVNKIHPEITT